MSNAQSGSSKRRKADSGVAINVSVPKPDTGASTPVFGLFPAAQPPKKTPFSIYTKSGALPNPKHPEPTVLAAETAEMEYESRNQMGVGMGGGRGESAGEAAGYSVQYMLGVHNPSANTLTLHSAPLHSFAPSVKANKNNSSATSAAQLFSAQRAALGQTFGTKKAQRQLNAQERNKLNDQSYGTGIASTSLQSLLQSSIAASSSSLPTSIDVEHAANLSRPTIPPPNFDAVKPNDVYSISDVVTPSELATIDLGPLLSAPTFKELNALLPFRRSKFISSHLRRLIPSRSSVESSIPDPSKRDREKLKLVVHLSQLFAFRQATVGGRDSALERTKLQEKMTGASPAVVSALLDRYTESQRMGNGEERKKMTGTMELKLLGYLLVVALKIDSWSTDVGVLAGDLGIGSKRVGELFRSLGCTLITPSVEDCEKLIATRAAANKAEARKSKTAVLRTPLEFPKERRGAPKR